MGWFDGWFGGGGDGNGSGSGSNSDPLRKLDPKLREFLERESPVKYTTASESPEQQKRLQQEQQRQQQKQAAEDAAAAAAKDGGIDDKPHVPVASLYQDGRYAHLWKTYRPLSDVEAETKTDHEKLMDVLEGYKERKAQIGRAALENCAEEQLDWAACMKGGDLVKRLTMCSTEVKKFERCYNTQSRMLKALGYLSSYDRAPSVDEDIQMRADSLYHRMLDQEAAVEKAKDAGLPAPVFPPLLDTAGVAAAQAAKSASAAQQPVNADDLALPAATAAAWKEKLEKLPEDERAAEEAALRAEFRAKAEMTGKIQALWQEQAREREARLAEGSASVVDKVKNFFAKFN
ncbi:hypothetical protein B0T17DRAFT_538190 [Bombardia bombarda]|uniref:Autophagy protein n=1 Tax=Bombardia bombarda TaxID=252184 RepID=A0AA39WNA4_9PEZI|nr:hypothetical protein B0T17DRAFT_538190 [Bombardia bombarda]